QVDEVVREPVAGVLELLDVAHPALRAVGELGEQVDEARGDLDGVRRGVVVEVEELALLRDERQTGHGVGVYHSAALQASTNAVSPSDPIGTVILRWGSIPLFSRHIRAQSHLASRAARSSSARRCSTTTGSRGCTSRAPSCSSATTRAASRRRSRRTSTSPTRTSTSSSP